MSRIEAEGSIVEEMLEALPVLVLPELREKQEHLAHNAREGTFCPMCGQFVKVYPRKLNSNMAAFLISLYRVQRDTKDWVHHTKCFHIGRDYPYLATWGLARMKPNEDDRSKRESGLWKTTKKGRMFIKENLFVPSHVFMYNNYIVGWSAKQVDIHDALGKKFNYAELMHGKVPE